ncbi:MAG: hypothetical protein Q8922_15915 [Bacteroidota bacterium]|nr:hypothetical protein [Bacteroidota bacterium]MDP4233184.1 hypothetical protein [Bacteroidota bacterium]MDP4242197.1 hypothetical protein [Bacteroidota bacterium]MDP4289401.1 hypothetical protein [Bacteroidota bacterium]
MKPAGILSSTPAKLAAALGLVSLYTFGLRPRMVRWGATPEEIDEPFPGANIIPGGTRSGTMAITIDAPPPNVWAYLVQMGVDRGGWYSWDNLDNWGRTSTDHVHPEWQEVKLGDRFYSMPDKSQWWEVAALEPEHFLGLRVAIDLHGHWFDPNGKKPEHYTDSIWGFLLKPLPGNRTRLIVSGYWDLQPKWLQLPASFFLLEPSHWIMQMRQFTKLKHLAEADYHAELEQRSGHTALRTLRRRSKVSGTLEQRRRQGESSSIGQPWQPQL